MKDADRGSVATVCSCAVPLTFGSLFAGIGGIDLGFERAGLQCKWQVEIDAYAQKVLAKHWPNVRRHDDVRTWPQPDTEYVDIIAGGFPCQDISYAGKGAGLEGERSGLFYEVMRIVSDLGPRIVVLENVAALLTRGLDSVLGSLASLGYDAEWHCVPAAAVGAPHKRDRVFIVAYANSDELKGGSHANGRATASELSGVPNAKGVRRGTRREGRTACTCSRQEDTTAMADAKSGGREARAGLRRDGESPRWRQFVGSREVERLSSQWAVEPAVDRVAYGVPARMDRLRGLGNAVVPQVAELIGRYIVAASKDVA